MEVGGVVGQHALAEQLLAAEGVQHGGLGAFEVVVGGFGQAGGDVEAVEAVPAGGSNSTREMRTSVRAVRFARTHLPPSNGHSACT